MTIQKRQYTNATVYKFKTKLVINGEPSTDKALNIVGIFNHGKSVQIIQRFWTDSPDGTEVILRQSQDMYYIERGIHLKSETIKIITQLLLDQ